MDDHTDAVSHPANAAASDAMIDTLMAQGFSMARLSDPVFPVQAIGVRATPADGSIPEAGSVVEERRYIDALMNSWGECLVEERAPIATESTVLGRSAVYRITAGGRDVDLAVVLGDVPLDAELALNAVDGSQFVLRFDGTSFVPDHGRWRGIDGRLLH